MITLKQYKLADLDNYYLSLFSLQNIKPYSNFCDKVSRPILATICKNKRKHLYNHIIFKKEISHFAANAYNKNAFINMEAIYKLIKKDKPIKYFGILFVPINASFVLKSKKVNSPHYPHLNDNFIHREWDRKYDEENQVGVSENLMQLSLIESSCLDINTAYHALNLISENNNLKDYLKHKGFIRFSLESYEIAKAHFNRFIQTVCFFNLDNTRLPKDPFLYGRLMHEEVYKNTLLSYYQTNNRYY